MIIDEHKRLRELHQQIDTAWHLLRLEDNIKEKEALQEKMQAPDFWQDQKQARTISERHEEIGQEIATWQKMRDDVRDLESLCSDLIESPDDALALELAAHVTALEERFRTLEFALLFSGAHDQSNAIVVFHAGSGGTEASDWAEMLLRMILRYTEKKGWKTTLLEESKAAEAGIKSAMILVTGRWAFGHLKSEHGTHRLVRISPFDAEQMRHTSFALIEVLPEIDAADALAIDPKDLRIDTYRSGGAGGQSVNKTDSAVRITHIPSGIAVACQNERSQHQNKEVAMKILMAKLERLEEEKQEAEHQKLRGEYKSPEWGSQIRSYVLHPYKMVKDLRTRYETKNPDAVLEGDLDPLVESYLRWVKEGKPNRKVTGQDEDDKE